MRALAYGLAASLVALGCGSSPAGPSPITEAALVSGTVTGAHEYHHAAGDTVDVEWQEAYHRWATEALGVAPTRRISYNKYRSREHMAEVIGVGNTNGWADAGTFAIHTIWPRDNHEVVHLYSSLFGRAVALWSEGLAVAYQTDPAAGDFVPRWSRVTLDDHARQFRASGRLIPIADLLTSSGFRRYDPNVTYPEAGSFVHFVIGSCGLAGVKQIFASGTPDDSASRVTALFESACGRTISAAEQAWLAMLESRAGGDD
jgi:hypothetical protein